MQCRGCRFCEHVKGAVDDRDHTADAELLRVEHLRVELLRVEL